jgi:hypothetical protein
MSGDNETLTFIGLRNYSIQMTIAQWEAYTDYIGYGHMKLIAFDTHGNQFELFCQAY